MSVYLTVNDVSDEYDEFAKATMEAFARKIQSTSETGLDRAYYTDAPLSAVVVNVRSYITIFNSLIMQGAKAGGCIPCKFEKTGRKRISGSSSADIIVTTWVGGYVFHDVDIDFVLIETRLEDSPYSSITIEPVFEDVHA